MVPGNLPAGPVPTLPGRACPGGLGGPVQQEKVIGWPGPVSVRQQMSLFTASLRNQRTYKQNPSLKSPSARAFQISVSHLGKSFHSSSSTVLLGVKALKFLVVVADLNSPSLFLLVPDDGGIFTQDDLKQGGLPAAVWPI